ncbi:alpha-protein kinase 3 isoform X3 [Cuculus canorus]|uniref:alpha-protein kinase 3 isoform X3 n=1 Tax=Cuculus canorus TaxID=55661 RepID=UPI0023AA2236|nr:alpha-protein kinase 3 isoform X3 [Cuculus canorus]
MGSSRRALAGLSGWAAGSTAEEAENAAWASRPDRRSYLLGIRPQNRSTFCAIISQLTEETQPLFETTIKSRSVSEDSDAKFTCIVTGYPQPEVTWYKDDEEMDRYCGLPKYEIFRHGNRHTLQLYKCREEDAGIYQASARNNKGIVSCSGVLEVGTMTEFKIHQKWFDKIKRKAEEKLREIEQGKKRGKENVEVEKLQGMSPDRLQRKRRLDRNLNAQPGSSPWEKEDAAKVHVANSQSRLHEDKAEAKEQPVSTVPGFPTKLIVPLKAEVTTNGDASLESVEEDRKSFLAYIYETVEDLVTKPTVKDSAAKKKKKVEAPPAAKQEASKQEESGQDRANASVNPRFAPTVPLRRNARLRAANAQEEEKSPKIKELGKAGNQDNKINGNVHFSLKELYFDKEAVPAAGKEEVAAKKEAVSKAVPQPVLGSGQTEGAPLSSEVSETGPVPSMRQRSQQHAQKSEGNKAIIPEVAAAVEQSTRSLKHPKSHPAIEGSQQGTKVEELTKEKPVSQESRGAGKRTNPRLRPQEPPKTPAPSPGHTQPIKEHRPSRKQAGGHSHALETQQGLLLSTQEEKSQGEEEPLLKKSNPPEPGKNAPFEQIPRQVGVKDGKSKGAGAELSGSHPGAEAGGSGAKEPSPGTAPGEVGWTPSGQQETEMPVPPSVGLAKEELLPDPVAGTAAQEARLAARSTPGMEAIAREVPSGAREVPCEEREVLSGAKEVPCGEREVLSGVREVPCGEREVLSGVREVPCGEREVLSGVREVPCGEREVLSGVREVPCGEREVLSGAKEVPCGEMEFLSGTKEVPCGEMVFLSGTKEITCGEREILSGAKEVPSGAREVLSGAKEVQSGAREVQSGAQLLFPVGRELEIKEAAGPPPQKEVPAIMLGEDSAKPVPVEPQGKAGDKQTTTAPCQQLAAPSGSLEGGAEVQPPVPLVLPSPERPPQMSLEEKMQHKNLVSSLKNYLLLLLKMSDGGKDTTKGDAEPRDEEQPEAEESPLPAIGIAGLSPRTSRRVLEKVQNNQLFQTAENLPLTPRTSRRITGMIHEEFITSQEMLACRPVPPKRRSQLAAEAEGPPQLPVPSIVVGSITTAGEGQPPPEGPPASPENQSPGDPPAVLPCATPEELASGARRKIYLPKPKPVGEEEEAMPESPGHARSPAVSPRQSRKNAALLQLPTLAPSSPIEQRSPTLTRKMDTLEVPKLYEEPMGDNSGDHEVPEDTKSEAQPGESKKANNPFKAPQVIRKIRAEQFSDASGNLKLWCQFFNILSDSKLTWYKDEVPVAEAQRSAGDEGQAALAIVQASQKDCGVYRCVISNEYGTDSTDFLLSPEVLSGFILREEMEVGEEIEMTPMVFAKGLADAGYWGDKLFGRVVSEDMEMGAGFLRKACRARAIYGLEPVFESGHTCIIKVHNFIAFGTKNENSLIEKNYDITIQECKIQNSSREYCKIFAAEARAVPDFGAVPEIIPLYLIYRPANNIPYATMEEDLGGPCEQYCVTERDGTLVVRGTSEIVLKCCTFQHWVYQWTNGNILVTDMEGVGWKMTNVRIATNLKGFQGLKESCFPSLLEQFPAAHQCNRYCSILGLKMLEPTKPKGSKSPSMGRKSAQSSPQLQKKGLASPQSIRKPAVSPKTSRRAPEMEETPAASKPSSGESGRSGCLQ